MHLFQLISSDLIQVQMISPFVLLACVLKLLIVPEQIQLFLCSLPDLYEMSLHVLLVFSRKLVIFEQSQVLRFIHLEIKILAEMTQILKK